LQFSASVSRPSLACKSLAANAKKNATMTRVIQNGFGPGSLKQIQRLINQNKNLIDKLIKSKFNEFASEEINWKSPLKCDDYAEYRDNCFLNVLDLNIHGNKLNEFWPKKGPQWDALASTISGKIILVEAKANIRELVTPPTGAANESKMKIDNALKLTKSFLDKTNDIDWSGKYYQYANRLAHLYFLRRICERQAYLVNIYFIGDTDVFGPKTQQEWEFAIAKLNTHLGIARHELKDFVTNIFINIKELK
jgi:hypothetical protein